MQKAIHELRAAIQQLQDDVRELSGSTEDLDSRLSDVEEHSEEPVYLPSEATLETLSQAIPGEQQPPPPGGLGAAYLRS